MSVVSRDRLPRLTAAEVSAEVAQATAVYRTVLGTAPGSFAAPGWRCTPQSLAAVDAAGFAYRSDTRGTSPYRPAANGRVFRVPEIPTTLPTLDELYGRVARRPQALVECLLQGLQPGQLNVHTLHAELEGGPHLDVLEALLTRVQGLARLVRLCDEATALPVAALPVCSVRDGAVPGRAMPVAMQGPPVSPAEV